MMTSALVGVYDHLLQIDEDVLRVIQGLDTGSPERTEAVDLYAHMAASAHIWSARIQGREARYPVWPELELEVAARVARESIVALRKEATKVEIEGGDGTVTYRNSAGEEFEDGVSDVLSHVALHASYHRGQLALLVRRAGHEPDWTEYIGFVRGARTPGR